jgi:MarR family transcriptional regulator, 2-MHQ and catechol-resistance regulon repressor
MKTTEKYGKEIDLALSTWVKLVRAFSSFNRVAMKDIAEYGITQAQFGVLECLGHLGPMTLGELTRKMLVSGGNMTVVVNNLERDGYVQRIRDAEDRRVFMVRLSPRGKAFFNEIFPKHAECIRKAASVLTAEEQVLLSGLLKKIGRGLRELS